MSSIELPRLKCQVNGVSVDALLDSGATCSFIQSKFAEKIQIKANILTTSVVILGNEDSMDIKGESLVELSVNNKQFQVNLKVLDMTEKVIIGWDLMRKLNLKLDPANDCVEIEQKVTCDTEIKTNKGTKKII